LQMGFEMKRCSFFYLIFLIIMALAFLPSAVAQEGGDKGTPTTPNTNKPVPKVPTPAPPQQTMPDFRRPQEIEPPPLFISGTVVREDGSPPPFGTVIEMDCGRARTKEATVGMNGYFSFQVGVRNSYSRLMPDASRSYIQDPFNEGAVFGNTMDQNTLGASMNTEQIAAFMMGCDLSARVPGFSSSILRVKKPLERGQNNLGTMVIYPLDRVKGNTVSATSLLAPKKAKKAFDRARKAVKKENFDEAEEALQSAIVAYPEYGEAWFELGQLYRQTQRPEQARDAYLKAVGFDEVFVQPYVGLSWILAMEKKWEETADLAEKVLELDPINFPEAYFLSALANHYLDNLDLAEKSARQLQRLDPEHQYPKVFLVLSNIYAKKSDELSSIKELRNYLRHAPDAEDADKVRSLLEEKLARADANKSALDFID